MPEALSRRKIMVFKVWNLISLCRRDYNYTSLNVSSLDYKNGTRWEVRLWLGETVDSSRHTWDTVVHLKSIVQLKTFIQQMLTCLQYNVLLNIDFVSILYISSFASIVEKEQHLKIMQHFIQIAEDICSFFSLWSSINYVDKIGFICCWMWEKEVLYIPFHVWSRPGQSRID